MNNISRVLITGILVIISGCLQGPPEQGAQITPDQTAAPATPIPATAIVTPTPTATPIITPLPRSSDVLDVLLRLSEPIVSKNGNLVVESFQVQIFNLKGKPLTVKARVVNDGQILEEHSFMLQRRDSSFGFTNAKEYAVSSTNLTLWVQVQGFEPSEYVFLQQ